MAGGIVVLTGAGISAESGLQTFRASDGLWEDHRIEDVATPEGFAANPHLVHTFYNARRAAARAAEPNAAHRALAELARRARAKVTLVTQNVDDLHERGGSTGVIHMHGALNAARCAVCDACWEAPEVMHPDDRCPACGHAATRPDIVWFGEMPYQMEAIEDALEGASLFLAIGTSGNVYPAAGFVELARAVGAETVEFNLERSLMARAFDRHILGPASETVPRFVAALLGDTADS